MSPRVSFAFSLTELLIGLFISSLLASLMLHQFFSVKTHYLQMSLTLHQTLEESLSLDLLRETIFNASFTPYGSIQQLRAINDDPIEKPLFALKPLPKPQQGFIAQRMGANFVPLITATDNGMIIPVSLPVQKNEPLIVCNWCCYQRVRVTSIIKQGPTQKLLLNHPLHMCFHQNSFVGSWLSEQYEVISKDEKHSGLFYKRLHREQLVDSWKSLRVSLSSIPEPAVTLILQNQRNQRHTIISRMANA